MLGEGAKDLNVSSTGWRRLAQRSFADGPHNALNVALKKASTGLGNDRACTSIGCNCTARPSSQFVQLHPSEVFSSDQSSR